MSTISTPSHVAFYGTLMSAFHWLDELQARHLLGLVGPCTIRGRLFDMGEWPTLVLGGGTVHGELFEVLDERVFERLDPFEDYDPADPCASSYTRVAVALLTPAVRAWLYVANGPVPAERHIPSGSWHALLGERADTG